MAKFLMVCARRGAAVPEARVRAACELLVPDHVVPAAPLLREAEGIVVAVIGPAPSLKLHDTSLCLGQMFGPSDGWWLPGRDAPDGSFALVRASADAVEVATDAVGSRSVFYAMSGDLFVASTSQRAIVAVLGSFRRNPAAVSWMLSCGTLGPGNSWDERVSRLGADASVTLDRAAWKLTRRDRPVVFRAERRSDEEHAARLDAAVRAACADVDLSAGEWRLPLSGGYDSRWLLVSLSRRYRIACVTWGTRAAQADPESDASVARALAAQVGVPHEFFELGESPAAFDVLFGRFLANGEGCVDLIGGYMDAFELWRTLHASGITGIVRGDEAFGWNEVAHESQVRPGLQATMLTDFYERATLEELGVAQQTWPAELQRGRGESLATWRDRLYQAYRIPVVLASLTDLKVPYVEVVNPFLSRRILDVVRTLPDHLRTDKVLFRRLVRAVSPPVPFATRSAIPNYARLVGSSAFREATRAEVVAGRDAGSLSPALAQLALATAPLPSAGRRAGRWSPVASLRAKAYATVRDALPLYVRGVLSSRRLRTQPPGVLAFRAAVVARMTRMLASDAASGAAVPVPVVKVADA